MSGCQLGAKEKREIGGTLELLGGLEPQKERKRREGDRGREAWSHSPGQTLRFSLTWSPPK